MSGAGGLFAAGLLLLGAAGLTGLGGGTGYPASSVPAEAGPARAGQAARMLWAALPYLLGCAGSVCLAVTGGAALAGHGARLDLGDVLGFGGPGGRGMLPGLAHTTLAADRLSGLFLLVAFGAAVPVSVAFANWPLRGSTPGRNDGHDGHRRRGLGALYALTLAAIAVIVTARDAFVLLFGWEALTAAFYLLAGFDRDKPGRPGEALVTFVFGKLSGASLLAGLLVLASRSGSLTLASFAQVPGGAARSTGYTLLVGAFAVKAGVVPFQVWLPRGYCAAPGPARAVMAGVASTAGFYGLWRTLGLLGPPPGWLAGVLLAAAAVTAILGIAHAAVATQLVRVIAYSSVENTGLILAGFGVALTGAATRDARLAAAGLLAATLQMITHAAAKSLLMLTGSRIESAVGTGNLDRLRGAGRQVRWSGTGFAVGALALAGLPPTAGFVSEWFLLESLMQQFRVHDLGFRLILAVAGAAVALTAGFAGVTFVRMIGLIAAGPPQERQRTGPDFGWMGRAGVITLAACCLGIAAVTPLEIRVIVRGLAALVPAGVSAGALRSPWVVQPVFAKFSILSPSWLWIAMPALLGMTVLVTWLASGRRLTRVRRVPAWRSATAGVEGTGSYTAFGFANPTRRVLASVLLTRAELRHLEQPVDTGGEPGAPAVPHLGYVSDVLELVEEYLYRPLLRPVRWLVRQATRLQSGRLDAYLAYMLITLVAVIAVVAALH
jgi:hydrogenase-4 component B